MADALAKQMFVLEALEAVAIIILALFLYKLNKEMKAEST